MPRYSLPVKSTDGDVIIRPLRNSEARRHPAVADLDFPPPADNRPPAEHQIDRTKIWRDILILATMAITAIAGSAVLLGLFWREVALARNETRLVEIEETARLRMAEIEAVANQQVAASSEILILTLAGAGIVAALACLLRPIIVTGR